MRVVVTGGAGFIGSHLVDALLAAGHEVRVVDDFSTGRLENLPQGHAKLQVVRADVREFDAIRRAFEGAELVFHLAALVSVPQSVQTPQRAHAINTTGTLNVLEAARQAGARRVVLASSAAVYGEPETLPLHEGLLPRPLSPYASSKVANEADAHAYTASMGLEAIALRFFNVYGPRQRADNPYSGVIARFVEALRQGRAPTVFGDGHQTRDFIFVSDVVEALLRAADAPASAAGQAYNVCTGQAVSLLELLDVLYRHFPHAPRPKFGPPRAGDIRHSRGDPTRAAQKLGFRARVSLEEGLGRLIRAMLREG
ncbi:MAG: NAD-dependent epimerase/dehydratase family protein [Chloroflexi bacterium]|nr:NAD-dependent epimerase/dehydratase family protein [Chloroflexota bacterium]